VGGALLVALLATGCGDGGATGEAEPVETECSTEIPAAPTGPTAPEPVADEDPPTGTIAGRLVHLDGEPIEALRLLACTASICYWDETDADGRFEVTELTLEPLKMQVGDPKGEHLDVVFYHLLDTTDVSEIPADIVVPRRGGEPVPWSDEGGMVSLADGELELEVEPGALTYPFGTKDKGVRAMRMEAEDLPPYDWTPWAGQESETFAFVINPVAIAVDPGATLRVHGLSSAACSVYRVWSVSAKKGTVSHAGTATVAEVDGALTLVTDPDAAITELTTLIFSPL